MHYKLYLIDTFYIKEYKMVSKQDHLILNESETLLNYDDHKNFTSFDVNNRISGRAPPAYIFL